MQHVFDVFMKFLQVSGRKKLSNIYELFSHHPSPSMCVFSASFIDTYLKLFHPGRRKQKPSDDEEVRVLKKPKLEEGKGFMYIYNKFIFTLIKQGRHVYCHRWRFNL